MELLTSEIQELIEAKQRLEHPSLIAKMTNLFGGPLEKAIDLLPAGVSEKLLSITHKALSKASDVALSTLSDTPGTKSHAGWHKLSVAVSGGLGGFFGLSAVALELPVSTTIMMRSIADIARSYGESLQDPETQLACLEVFALGGTTKADDGSESGYFMARAGLAKSASDVASFVARHGVNSKGAPVVLKFLLKIAETFNIQVTQKVAAQALPAVGAAGGALVNTLFIDHFQEMARGHFAVRRLERKYSKALIETYYHSL